MSVTRGCKPSMETRTSTSCHSPLTARSRISSCKQKWENIRTSFGLWSRKHRVRAKVFKSSQALTRCRVAQDKQPAWFNSTSPIHCWSMASSGTLEFMWLLLQSIRLESMFTRKDCAGLQAKNMTLVIWKTFIRIWPTTVSIRRICRCQSADNLWCQVSPRHRATQISIMVHSIDRIIHTKIILRRRSWTPTKAVLATLLFGLVVRWIQEPSLRAVATQPSPNGRSKLSKSTCVIWRLHNHQIAL